MSRVTGGCFFTHPQEGPKVGSYIENYSIYYYLYTIEK